LNFSGRSVGGFLASSGAVFIAPSSIQTSGTTNASVNSASTSVNTSQYSVRLRFLLNAHGEISVRVILLSW
jgi:hypothetical protein